ncbi:hypothetical protein FXO37_14070 [Capsicum annuum]|nr:hypothetical protein FXO37_14070 [Capsicum annuum]
MITRPARVVFSSAMLIHRTYDYSLAKRAEKKGRREEDPDWAENRSKHRNDPVTMKKLRDKAASKSKKSTSKASKKKFDDSDRPRLPKGMKYRIDKVPPHPLHMGSLCNCAYREEIKEYFGEDVLGAFKNMIFGIFLNLPRCNWIGQISKCLLMLEIQQDNKDELHVWVQGEILKFTILEFAIISGLKYIGTLMKMVEPSSDRLKHLINPQLAGKPPSLGSLGAESYSQLKDTELSILNWTGLILRSLLNFPEFVELCCNIGWDLKARRDAVQSCWLTEN